MSQKIQSFLILFNISKGSNFGFLLRTANAFGAEVIVVGRRHFSRRGANAKTRYTKTHRFFTMQEAVDFARSRGCSICGVEITSDAKSVVERPFSGPTAFVIGNEGEGLLPKQMAMCDELVYVPPTRYRCFLECECGDRNRSAPFCPVGPLQGNAT